jgi:TetR/AcrR family tetracycline transcriptional repressor
MQQPDGTRRRGLTREAVVARALDIADAEGLEAVSLRRLASELGVTPMALYRHVRDKQDLVNAMTEAVLEDLDIMAGIRPSMRWTEQMRLGLMNLRDQMVARPVALPLMIAYSGDGSPGLWRLSEAFLGLLLGAGFSRRDAAALFGILSNLVAGYLMLRRAPGQPEPPGATELDLVRRRVELAWLSLPRAEYPHTVESARELADAMVSDPDRWWRETVDLIVFGLEAMLERARRGPLGAGGPDRGGASA